jgi:hypothetical protein
VLGSGVTCDTKHFSAGIPGSVRIQQSILSVMAKDFHECRDAFFERYPNGPDAASYPALFSLLEQFQVSPKVALGVIREAVLSVFEKTGYEDKCKQAIDGGTDEAVRRALELELLTDRWTIRPGIQFFAQLAVGNPTRFGRTVITTNFDPLIEVAMRRAGGSPVTISLRDSDSDIIAVQRVIHVHGHWTSDDMVSSQFGILRRKEKVEHFLDDQLTNTVVVVLGYGGYDEALVDVLRRCRTLYWCSHSDQNSPALKALMSNYQKGADQTLFLVKNVDSDEVLKAVYDGANDRNLLVAKDIDWSVPPLQLPGEQSKDLFERLQAVTDDVRYLTSRVDQVTALLQNVETVLSNLQNDSKNEWSKFDNRHNTLIDTIHAGERSILAAIAGLDLTTTNRTDHLRGLVEQILQLVKSLSDPANWDFWGRGFRLKQKADK